jgi:LPS sulfotransferase NodH
MRAELVAVPQATAEHAHWAAPLRQVAGWAAGDVRCLDALPRCAFYAAPNWAVLALAALLLQRWAWALLAVAVEAALLAATYAHGLPQAPVCKRTAILALAVLPPMLQDVVRLGSKLVRGRLLQILQCFDWMDGQGGHAPATQTVLLIKATAWATSVAAVEHVSFRPVAVAALAAMIVLWVYAQGRVMAPRRAHCSKPLQLRTAATPFVVLATQRTGSNMLCGLLHVVRGVHMHNELINEKGVFTHCRGISTDRETRNAAPEAFLAAALAVADAGAVGFKLFPEHVRRSMVHAQLFGRVLADPAIKKVILRRENQVAVAASRLRAATTGAFTHTDVSSVEVWIDPAEMQAAVDSYDDFYTFLRKATAGQNVLHMTYEDLCAAPLPQLQAVCAFLGVRAPMALPGASSSRRTLAA